MRANDGGLSLMHQSLINVSRKQQEETATSTERFHFCRTGPAIGYYLDDEFKMNMIAAGGDDASL